MAIKKFTSKEFIDNIRQTKIGKGSYIETARVTREMKNKKLAGPLFGKTSRQGVSRILKRMEGSGIISHSGRIQAEGRFSREAGKAEKPKGPSPEELRKQVATRRRDYNAQQDRLAGQKVVPASTASSKKSPVSRVVPLAGSRIDSVGPSNPEASKNSQYQSLEKRGPENVIERGSGLQSPPQGETIPSADEANDLPIE